MQEVIENVVSNVVATLDAFIPVETPMDPQVDAALAIFLRRVAEVVERARHDWPNLAIGAPRYAIKLIRYNGKANVVGAVEPFQDFEHGGAQRGVTAFHSKIGSTDAAWLTPGNPTQRAARLGSKPRWLARE